jgi:hypothetical protein
MNAESIEPGTGTRRAAEWLFTLSAVGEIGVGLLVALLPGPIMGLLLGAPLAGTGTVAARMTGIAIAALGIAWWPDRSSLDPRRLRQVAAGFIGYNLGMGLLLLAYAWTAGEPLPVTWLVAAAHLLAGCAFAVVAYGALTTEGAWRR